MATMTKLDSRDAWADHETIDWFRVGIPFFRSPFSGFNSWRTLFEAGRGDGYWNIEASPDGYLYVSSNAETRRRLEGGQYQDVCGFLADLADAGVPIALVNKIGEQIGA